MLETGNYLNENMKSPVLRISCSKQEPDLVQAVVEARKRLNITQKELSKRTGISQGNISKIESGATNPSVKVLQRLVAGLDMTLTLETFPQYQEMIKMDESRRPVHGF